MLLIRCSSALRWLGLGLSGLTILVAGFTPRGTFAQTQNCSLRLETFRQAEPLTLAVYKTNGKQWIALKTAVEYLAGQVSWQEVTNKVVITGPTGRQVVLTMGMPKLVLNRETFVRLPQLPCLWQGRLMVTPETLLVIWQQVEEHTPLYDADQGVFKISETPAVAPTATVLPQQPSAHSQRGLVVVDAGHGGKDPGAIGPSRLQEKVVTLEVAQQITRYLQQAGVKVIMTRDRDSFISLAERANVANRQRADLFISIHANAAYNSKVNGSQVFIYNREASSRAAAEAARLENQDANYLEIIKDDLRQSVHEKSSITAAGLVSQELEKMRLDVKRIERAPFYVLAKSFMPSILVETAFISNLKEERLLRRREFCRQLAVAIYNGIQQYYKEKEKQAEALRSRSPLDSN